MRSDILDDLMKKQKEVENIRKNKEKYTGRVDPTKGKTSKRTTFGKPVTVKPEGEFHTNEFQSDKSMTEDAMSAPTNSTGSAVTGTGDDSSTVVVKKKKGEPTIIARGCMPGARSRFKGGVQLLASLKKNKYT